MACLTSVHSRPSAATLGTDSWSSCFPLVAKLWRELFKSFFDSYRPELHYMRGPGPRWREKHDAASPHGSGAYADVEDVRNQFTVTAPDRSSSRPGAHAAGPASRPAALISAGRASRARKAVVQITRLAAGMRRSRARPQIEVQSG
jgi:hypothetical protein